MQALFDIPQRANDEVVLKKAKKKATTATKKSGGSIADRVNTIKAMVETHLGKYREEYEVISDEDRLKEYLDKAYENGVISIDTETTGLNPMQDSLVGICLYTPEERAAYVPVGHVSYVTGQKSKNQLSLEVVVKCFEGIDSIDIIMFNADFDLRIIKHNLGVKLHCDWDCYIAARCLNENEPSNKLKKLHQKYVLRGKEDEFSFEELFKGLNFAYVPIQTAYLYAAHDAIATYEYYEYQKKYLRVDHEREDMRNIYWVFKNIEMPCVDVVVEMEDTGIEFDMQYAEELHVKYHKILDEKLAEFQKAYHMYDDEIKQYDGKVRFDEPININSVPQLQALLYDIIGLEGPIDKKTKEPSRSTSEEVLEKLSDNAVVKAILDYREFSTIVSTFIDKLPECVNKKDGRIHCKFNQYGADTGRFSSQDPNLQNIPHTADIRQMFKATDGYVLLSSDFSQQEVKGMAQMCGDEGMMEAFRQGKDFYAQIASVSFNMPYEDCLEFRPDGTTNPEGKARRSQAKSILLGINYGRGAQSIAEQLGCSKKKAEKIKDDVFRGFPAIEKFEKDSLQMVEDLGYVTTLWGRKRRLPVMQLPDYEFEWADGAKVSDDPLNFDEDVEDEDIPEELIRKYVRKLKNAWGKQKVKIFQEANQEGIWIIDNTKDKTDATRQVVNARIQGTAADQSKLAMIALSKDRRLKELGFRMLIPVHDEIIAECPKENAKEVAKLFADIMSNSGGEKFTIPISCDVSVSDRWYGEELKLDTI